MTWSDHPQGDSNLWSGHHGRSHVKFKTFLHETDGSQIWQISGFWQEATNQKIEWFFYQVATCDKFMWQIISNLAPYLAPYRRDIWLPHLIRLWLRSHHSQSHITTKTQNHMLLSEAIFTSTRLMTSSPDRFVTSFVIISGLL